MDFKKMKTFDFLLIALGAVLLWKLKKTKVNLSTSKEGGYVPSPGFVPEMPQVLPPKNVSPIVNPTKGSDSLVRFTGKASADDVFHGGLTNGIVREPVLEVMDYGPVDTFSRGGKREDIVASSDVDYLDELNLTNSPINTL